MDHCRRSLLICAALWLWPILGSAEESVVLMKPVTVELKAEALRDLDIRLPLGVDLLYKADLLPAEPPSEDLAVGFFDPGSKNDPRALEASDLVRSDGSLHLRILAERCCPSGTYQRVIELIPQQGAAWPIYLPVHITVQGSAWTCHRSAITFLLILIAGIILNLYICGMIGNSHFLPRRRLAMHLRPLLRNGLGGLEEGPRKDVEALVARDLSSWRRTLNWLRANPLVFGLPGGSYRETIELHLRPRRNVSASRLTLIPRRNYSKILQKQPQLGQGRLFAAALEQLRFFAVPHRGRVGELIVRRPAEDNAQAELVWINPDQDLLRDVEGEESPAPYAGWRIGG